MAGTIDDSQQPYGDKYNVAKRFSKVLFRPGRPAFSSELLESESILQHQLAMLGNSLFLQGAIISGMDIVPLANKPADKTGIKNLFTLGSLVANNLQFNTSDYAHLGRLKIDTEGHMPSDVASLNFSCNVSTGIDLWVTFNVQQISGSLNKINLTYDHQKLSFKGWTIQDANSATTSANSTSVGNATTSAGSTNANSAAPVTNSTGDGDEILSNIDDQTTAGQLVDTNGQQIKLNDGSEHRFVVHFTVQDPGPVEFGLVINGGYNLTQNSTVLNINKMYVQQAQNPAKESDWQANSADLDTPSAQERVCHYQVNAGRVYINGMVREFDQQDIWIKGVGKEEVGLRLDEDIVTSAKDPTLLDDTPNAVTQGAAGADRLHYAVVLTYNDTSAVPFVTFQDNVINSRAVKPDYSNLEPILAKRTYDQSGSFLSYGFDAHMKLTDSKHPELGAQDPTDANKILLTIDSGQAYVLGYSVSTLVPTVLKLDTATEKGHSTGEGFNYQGDGSIYYPANQPVYQIDNVNFRARATANTSHVVGAGLIDTFVPNTNVVYIDKVWDTTREYTEGTNFTYSGNKIYWGEKLDGTPLPGNPQIPAGAYQVTYEYNVNATEGTDYKLVTDTNGQTGIDIDDMHGAQPIPGTSVTVDYDYFQARIDMIRITMDQSDPFKIVPGKPAALREVTPPSSNDPYTLELGYVLIMPNSHQATFTMQTTTRITFDTLQQWGMRLTNVELNAALNQLTESVKQSEDPTVLKDAFADSFATVDLMDSVNTTAAYDFDTGTIFVPSQAQADLEPTVNEDLSNISVKGNFVRPPFHEDTVCEQPIWTSLTNINEYNVCVIEGDLSINPSSDNWINSTKTTAFTTVHEPVTLQLDKWWRHLNDHSKGWYGDGRDPAAHAAEQKQQQSQWDQLAGLYDPGSGNTLGETGWMIADGGSTTSSTAVEYMRQKTITFHAENLRPKGQGYKLTIDGVAVSNPQPESSDYGVYDGPNGTFGGTFKADVNGEIKGTFDIPGGIRCGTREVKIANDSGDRAVTTYTANGSNVTTTDTIEKRIYDVNLWDPLAQSFTLSETRQLSSVDLYFGRKPSWDTSTGTGDKTSPGGNPDNGIMPSVIVQIRTLGDQGYPTNLVVAETHLRPDQVQTSADASIATRVVFDNPVTLTANQGYAICLISESDKYWVYTAKGGETVGNSATSETSYYTNSLAEYNTDPNAQGENVEISEDVSVHKGDLLTRTPNSNGNLFYSNNAQTWSANGAASLKFRVNCAYFEDSGEVVFAPISISDLAGSSNGSVWEPNTDLGPNLDGKEQTANSSLSAIDRLVALTTYLTYKNTAMHWFIRILPSSTSSSSADIQKLPWKPLNVVNQHTYTEAPGVASTQGTPQPTNNLDPQQVGGEVALFQNSTAIQLKAEFECDKYIAPILTTEDLSLAAMLTGKQAVYQTQCLDESGDAKFNMIKLQFDAYLPNVGTTETAINPMFSIDNGVTWLNFPKPKGKDGNNNPIPDYAQTTNTDNKKDSSTLSVPTSQKPMSAYYTRMIYTAQIQKDANGNAVDVNHLADKITVRLNMTSNTNFHTPRVRKLVGTLKQDLSGN